jgi:predicted acetyltransferase
MCTPEIRPATRDEIPEVFQFQAKCYGLPEAHFRELSERDPWFKPGNILLLRSSDEIASCLQIFPKPIRIGSASVTIAGVGNVATHPGYQGRGYATRLLEQAVGLMKDRGYGLSILFTKIHGFYQRLGWGIACPRYKYVIPAAERGHKDSGEFQVEPLEQDDLNAVMRIHEASNKRRTLSVQRSAGCWQRQLSHRLAEEVGSVVARKDGGALAYGRFTATPKRLWIIEAGSPRGDKFEAPFRELLKYARARARERGLDYISAYIPPDIRLADEILKSGGQNKTRSWSGLMVRVVSLERLFKSILPELNERASDKGISGRIQIRTDEGEISLKIEPGGVEVAKTGSGAPYRVQHPTLAQHLTGYLPPTRALAHGLAQADAATAKLLDALFETEIPPHFWRYDRF